LRRRLLEAPAAVSEIQPGQHEYGNTRQARGVEYAWRGTSRESNWAPRPKTLNSSWQGRDEGSDRMPVSGTILDIQRYAIHDGPGIRTTVFFKGCPLCCQWCHNPESQAGGPVIVLAPNRCIHCGTCVKACPQGAAAPGPEQASSRAGDCVRCGACATACPSEARTLLGRELLAEEVIAEVEQDRVFYEESGGGVTFSGGEPLMQTEFLLACLALCRKRGYATAVDTCGYAPPDVLWEVAALTDLFLYDLKHMDEARHRSLSGVSNELILSNLQGLIERGGTAWIRFPLIPGINDDEDNVEATAAFVRSLKRPMSIQVLPYHRLGSHKYTRLGASHPIPVFVEPTPEDVARVTTRLSTMGVEVRTGD